ncbi:MAG: hypothetical protein RDU25_01970 [Patescibacteria group bacterium]|nr:hypothetical protein [Patescibacteria group bacterium]
MRKFITFLSTAAMVILPLCVSFSMPAPAQAASVGLIKGPYDTVYWLSSNGKRYVFPTYNTFFSWYGYSSPAIQQLSLDQLGTITIGGNVTYKPGVRLIKVTTNPKVYAVSRYGVLRWITSEAIATQLYGANWALMVDDLPDPFFVNYNIGADINNASDFNPTEQSNSVTTPDDNIGTAQPTSPTNPTQNVGPTAPVVTAPVSNQILTNYPRTLTISWSSNVRRHYVEVQCDFCGTSAAWSYVNFSANTDNYTNSVVTTALAGDNQFRVRVKAIDESNRETWSNYVYFSFKTSAASSGPAVPTITSPTANQIFTNYPRTLTAQWSNDGAKKHTLEVACDYCSSVTNMYSNPSYYVADNYATTYAIPALAGDNTFRIRAKATNDSGVDSAWSDYVYFSFKTAPTAPAAPTITSPYSNQQYTNYPRTLTVTWANDNQLKHNVEVACDYCVSVSNPYSGATTYVSNNYAMSYALPALAGDNTFRVRVQAVDASGVAGAWSNYVYFSFKTPSGPSAPTIISPVANHIFTNYPRSIDVFWSNDNQKSHTVEVACDVCGTGAMWSSVASYYADSYATGYQGISLAGDNQFRVRVKATNASGVTGPWSDWVYFRSSTSISSAPRAPWITAPYSNQIYTNYPRTLTAKWFNDTAKKHTLEVACDYCSSVTNMYSNPSYYVADNYTTSYALPALAGDNQFRIRVKATNENGVDSVWSDYVYFKFKTAR